MSDRPPVLVADSVSFSVGRFLLVDDVSMTLEPNRITGILGPNGAGKSTLLKLLSGELEPTKGSITMNGVPLAGASAVQLSQWRAVVAQSPQLTFPFTALEVVLLGATVPGFGAPAPKQLEAARKALALMGLTSIRDRLYVNMSGGERQRVHIARALCQLATSRRRPDQAPVLFLDEPTSSLDLSHQRLVLEAMRELAAQGMAVLAILHDVNLAAAFADRLLVMNRGRVVAAGAPREVVESRILSEAYGCQISANTVPQSGIPFVLPVTQRGPGVGAG